MTRYLSEKEVEYINAFLLCRRRKPVIDEIADWIEVNSVIRDKN